MTDRPINGSDKYMMWSKKRYANDANSIYKAAPIRAAITAAPA